ncbi:diguanylate cyclase (GGDEF)-like protein [Alkalibaculum bacchi]|uniref:Diguanylate cyclase (GGDEF)-like protein n=2 Tax=Alkalibaculum bacchi TaxID=645887 RepID=A0A366HZR8_9FIRM|nr:GGDEF domain-containing protein [Alkalibaculum bacchi]RBP59108.1 diguanylate cyclase (GGDEF)-like protein [Alkalibaculum bacchi]
MIERLKQFLIQNYFGKQFSLEYRVYMIFFFESYFLSIISGITNTLLNKGLFGQALQWSYIIFCTIIIFVIPRIRLIILKPHLLFIAFIYIPLMYFQTAGYDGTALLFAQLALFLLGIVFSGKTRMIIIVLNILTWLVCIIISFQFPQTVTFHRSSYDLLIDLIVALILTFTGLSILTTFISNIFADKNDTLAELSIRDALTGAYNRRFMTSFLQCELDTSRQTGNAIYVLMLDIDHFKQVNDTYGHGFGDHVLLACVQGIKSVLRKCDVVVRYGGEEFVIILLTQIPTNASQIAERIRHAISSLRFHYDVSITVSIGVTASRFEDTIEDILDRADQCLYKAKLNGRNQVVMK